jgi:hypothetical protein
MERNEEGEVAPSLLSSSLPLSLLLLIASLHPSSQSSSSLLLLPHSSPSTSSLRLSLLLTASLPLNPPPHFFSSLIPLHPLPHSLSPSFLLLTTSLSPSPEVDNITGKRREVMRWRMER